MGKKSKNGREPRKPKSENKKKRPRTEYQQTRDLERRRRKKGSNGIFEDI